MYQAVISEKADKDPSFMELPILVGDNRQEARRQMKKTIPGGGKAKKRKQ